VRGKQVEEPEVNKHVEDPQLCDSGTSPQLHVDGGEMGVKSWDSRHKRLNWILKDFRSNWCISSQLEELQIEGMKNMLTPERLMYLQQAKCGGDACHILGSRADSAKRKRKENSPDERIREDRRV